MKSNLRFFVALILFTYFCWSQESSKLIIDKNYIAISKPADSSTKPIVYNGELSESELTIATPILGETISNKESVRFIPLIPFTLGQKYTVQYDNIIDYFKIHIPEGYKNLSVEGIYPSSEKLPSNVLKWHLRFSKPINQVNIYDHIHFINSSRDTLRKSILHLENALISEDEQLLTIWIDPGRQKRGLIPNQQMGSVFEEGKEYSLIVSKKITDKEGISMNRSKIHRFIIANADREKPDINLWKINVPNSGTTSELTIDFNESMDFASALSRIIVVNSKKEEIMGARKLVNNESTLVFQPKEQWLPGEYEILIDSRIEDLAGNNLNRLFDSEITDALTANTDKTSLSLRFLIK